MIDRVLFPKDNVVYKHRVRPFALPIRAIYLLLSFLFLLGNASTAFAADCSTDNSINITTLYADLPATGLRFYVDLPTYIGSYVGYNVDNQSGSDIQDLWIKIENFASATTPIMSLGDFEDGIAHPGYVSDGVDVSSYYHLKATAEATDETHDIVLYTGDPSAGGSELCRETFTVDVEDVIQANANKIDVIFNGSDPPELGGTAFLIIEGNTGTIGSARTFSGNPAAETIWRADAFEITDVIFEFTGGNNFTNTGDLAVSGLNTSNTTYVLTYYFRITSTTTTDTDVLPLNNIASGSVIKHTSVDSFGSSFEPIPPVQNYIFVETITVSPKVNASGGNRTVTVTYSNDGSSNITLDALQVELPTSPGTVTFNSAVTPQYNGENIPNPTISGSTLSWGGSFAIPANSSASLVFDVTVPATNGLYTIEAIGVVGTSAASGVQIDSTKDTTDDLPIKTDFAVGTPLIIGDLIFNDLNANGIKDTSESGISGISIDLYLDDGDEAFEPGASADDGDPISTETTDANGAYSFIVLSAGKYWINITDTSGVLTGGTKTSGNTLPELIILGAGEDNYEVDYGYDIPPVITVARVETNDTTPQLNGTIDDPLASISVTVNSIVYSTAVNNGDGTWVLTNDTITPALVDGVYDVTAEATDNSSLVGTDPTDGELIISNRLMSPPTVNFLNTSDTTPIITGTFDEAKSSSFSVTVNGTTYVLGTDAELTNSGDVWTLDLSSLSPVLGDGIYEVVATSTDVVSATKSDATNNELTIDNSPPAAPGTPDLQASSDSGSSDSDDITSLSTLLFDVSCQTGATVELVETSTVVGSATCFGGTATITVTSVSDGSHTYHARQTDGAGTSTDSGTLTFEVDAADPTVDIQGEPTAVNDTSAFSVTFEFSEDVTGFALGDISVGNGSASNFAATDGNTYTADITPDGNGNITIDVASAKAQDAAGNDNTAATQAVVTYDATDPTVDIQGEPTAVNDTSAFSVTFEFSEDVTGFALGDISVGNGSASNFAATDGNTYTADITPDGNGDITIDVASAKAQDAAGNDNTAATQAVVTYDATDPTVDIQGEPTAVNDTSAFSVTFEFSEDVTGFALGDISVGNGSASNFAATDGNTYTADITPDGNGDITIDVASAKAQDAAGNDNTAATQAVVTYDATDPTVDIQGEPTAVNDTSAFSVTFEFSEDVTGFALGDISVGNGSASNFAATDGNTYTADITPDGNGDITIDVASAKAQDAAGNDNTAATQAVVTYDATDPTVDIQGEPTAVNDTSAFSVTFEFSEDVTGFALGDISVGNGSASNFAATDGNTYTADITPDGNGDITIDVASAKAQDAAGNDNTAATQAVVTYDATDPTVDIQGEPTAVNDTSAFSVTFEFSEDVTGFALGDISVGNGSASNFAATDGNTYTADITPDGNGDITIDVASAKAQDAAGNDNTAATQAVVTYDATDPTVDIQGEPTAVNDTSAFSVTFEFSEDVTGFALGDISVGNGSASNFAATDGNTYTADITPDGNGDITIDVASAKAQDAAGNDNTAATQAVVTYDATDPTVDIQGEPTAVNDTSAFSVTFEFSEDVTGFALGDISVGNGSASNFAATDGNTYTADITPDGNGDITIDVASAKAQDAAGNDNTAATQAVVTYDATDPTVDIQGEPTAVNDTSAFSVTFEFSEDVTGFALGDISVGNGSASNFAATDGNTYTADITPDGNGDITIDVASAKAQDAAGNDNTAATQAVVTYDATDPTVDIQGEPTAVNDTSAFSVTFEFSEDVTGFALGDISVGNGSASNFAATDGNTYTADITPDGNGDITIDVASAKAQDAAGNDNTAATQAVVTYDATDPTVDIQGEPTAVNDTSAFSVTFEFSEDVTGFALGDISVGNGSASNFAATDGNTYTADITPDGNGDITIDVASAKAQDAAGNDNTAATQAVVTYDATDPTVDIQGEPTAVNDTSAFSVTFEFSEDVTGFALGDISVGNGSASNFAATDGNTYTADITPDGNGDITIDVASAKAQDAAGNDNTAATQAVVTYDATDPTVDIQGEPTAVNDTSAFSVTFEFSEDVTGFALGDISVGNGSASNFAATDGNTYTADITPDGNGDITIDVASAKAQDAAGNDNTAATQAVVTYDATDPTVDIQGEPTAVNDTSAFSVTFEFSEDVTGFALGDISVGNGSASNFAATDGNTYTADITPDGNGDITIDVASAKAQDAAGNDNTAATQAVVTYDATDPTVDIQGEPTAVNDTSAFSVTFEFSEDVTGFALGDISVGNGSASNFAATDGNTYTADITPDGNGDITIDVASAKAQDAAGNDNTAATQAVVTYDATDPTVDIQGEPTAVNDTSAFSVTFEFSEDVTGFALGDISVGNGSASNFAATDGNTYTADITPDGNGDITIDVASAKAQDAAGNDNTAATQAVVTYDATDPTVDIQGEPTAVNDTSAFSVTFEFSEDVTGFALGDISVGNGSASNFAATDGNTYTADITPDGNGDITIDVASAKAQDAAGNDNTAATQAVVTYDATDPTVDIQGEPTAVNDTSAFSVTFEFSEDVTGFALGDISVGNGSASNFAATDGNTYTADITPDGNGNITIDVASAKAQDAAGNDNTAATQAVVTYDATDPTVDIQGEPTAVNDTSAFSVTFEFSEDVTGFALGDISVGNGSASNFAATDGNTYTADITPDGNGDITIDVASAKAQDAAGNDNTAATQAVVTYDATDPTVDIQGEPTAVNDTSAFSVTFEFSEDVTGFALGDISVGNGSASNFAATDGNTYTADITPDGNGDITIDVASAKAQDAAGNDNTAATQAVVTYDATDPTVDIQGEPTAVNDTSAFSVTFEFSEDVTGFALGDISVGNGSASNFAATDGNTYTADITPDGNGNITIDVASAKAQDAAGNDNTAANQAVTVFNGEVLKSPVYMIWNGFYNQTNIAALGNRSNKQLDLHVSLLNIDGEVLSTQNISLAPYQEFDLSINDMPGFGKESYGLLKIEFQEPGAFEGYSGLYRVHMEGAVNISSLSSDEIDFSIQRPFRNWGTGKSYALFNTVQPSPDPMRQGDEIPNWLQIANIDESETRTFIVRKYNNIGLLIQQISVDVPPQGRRDVEAGHEFPGLGHVGLVEIEPLDGGEYLAQIFTYGTNNIPAYAHDSFSFAHGETARQGTSARIGSEGSAKLIVSSGANAMNWIAISNVGQQEDTYNVVLTDAIGDVVYNEQFVLTSKSQVHLLASKFIPGGQSGRVSIQSVKGEPIIANSRSYYFDDTYKVSAAGLSIERGLLAETRSYSFYNTFLNQHNWLRLNNITSDPVVVQIDVLNSLGSSLGSSSVTLLANQQIDLELTLSLGISIPKDSVGMFFITPDTPGSILSSIVKVRLDLVNPYSVDLVKTLPVH